MAGHTFNADATRQIRDVVRQIKGEPRGPEVAAPQTLPEGRNRMWAYTPIGGIPALSGATLGTAECELYTDAKQSLSANERDLAALTTPGGDPVTGWVHNCSATAIGGSIYVPIEMSAGGAWRAVPVSTTTPTYCEAQATFSFSSGVPTRLALNYASGTLGPWSSNQSVIETQTSPTVYMRFMQPGKYHFYNAGYAEFSGSNTNTMTLWFQPVLWDGASTYSNVSYQSTNTASVVLYDTVNASSEYVHNGIYFMATISQNDVDNYPYLTGRFISRQAPSSDSVNAYQEMWVSYYAAS